MRCGISVLVILRVLDANMSPFATATAVRSFRRPLTGSPTRAPTSRRCSRKLKAAGAAPPFRELAEADKAGRLAVLPCKVGDTLWVTGRDNVPREMELEAPDIRAVCTDEDNLCMSTCNRKPDGFCAYRLRNDGADVGKTVFLTREEAEKALEAMKDE